MNCVRVVVAFLILLSVVCATHAQDSLNVGRIGECRYFEYCTQAAFHGGYVYAASYPNSVILDCRNPQQPVPVGRLPWAQTIAVSNSVAVLVGSDAYILDVSQPNAPQIVAACGLTAGVNDAVIDGDFVYITGFPNNRLYAVDISVPHAPVIVDSIVLSGTGYRPYVNGQRLYVCRADSSISVFDVSDPSDMQYLGGFDTPAYVQQVIVRNFLAYACCGDFGISIHNVADPALPLEVGRYVTVNTAFSAFLQDTFLYLADGNSGLQILSVSEPDSPAFIGRSVIPGRLQSVCVENDTAYCAANLRGVRMVDVSMPDLPVEIGAYDVPGTASVLCKENDRLVVGFPLSVCEFSPPLNVREIGYARMDGVDLIYADGYVYRAFGDILSVHDARDPGTILYTGGVALGATISDLERWNHGVIAASNTTLSVVDMVDPSNPVVTDTAVGIRILRDIDVQGNLVFAAAHHRHLIIFDISDPDSIRMLSSTDMLNGIPAYRAKARGDSAYVITGDMLHTVNVTDPGNPVIMSSCEVSGGEALDMEVVGEYVIVATENGGIRILHPGFSDPPEVGFYHIPGEVLKSMQVIGETIYVAGDSAIYALNWSQVLKTMPEPVVIPGQIALHPCYPNPFNPVTTILYDLPVSGNVQLSAWDVLGRRIGVIFEGMQTAGIHHASFDGSPLASGIYFVRLHSGSTTRIQKAVLLK